MSYLEKIEIIGDIGSCELKQSDKGSYLKISVAANRKNKNTGSFEPQWYQGYIAGKMAANCDLENLKTHFRPGRLVRITGFPNFNYKNNVVNIDIMLSEMPLLLDKSVRK